MRLAHQLAAGPINSHAFGRLVAGDDERVLPRRGRPFRGAGLTGIRHAAAQGVHQVDDRPFVGVFLSVRQFLVGFRFKQFFQPLHKRVFIAFPFEILGRRRVDRASKPD